MEKTPIDLKKEDLKAFKGKTIELDICDRVTGEIIDTVKGTYTKSLLAGNPPNLPAKICIQTEGKLVEEKEYNIFQIKDIRIIE